MTRTALLPSRKIFIRQEPGAYRFRGKQGGNRRGGRNTLYYLSRKTPTHPTPFLRNKRDKGRNRNITKAQRKKETEREREKLESISETVEERKKRGEMDEE